MGQYLDPARIEAFLRTLPIVSELSGPTILTQLGFVALAATMYVTRRIDWYRAAEAT